MYIHAHYELLYDGASLSILSFGKKRSSLETNEMCSAYRDEKSQLLLGVRRANRKQTALTSSVLSTDSMHIGVLAVAAHAVATWSPFTVYYNPRYIVLLLFDHHVLKL